MSYLWAQRELYFQKNVLLADVLMSRPFLVDIPSVFCGIAKYENSVHRQEMASSNVTAIPAFGRQPPRSEPQI